MEDNTPPTNQNEFQHSPEENSFSLSPKRTQSGRVSETVKTQAQLIEESFDALSPQAEVFAFRFYERLFQIYPQLTPLFQGVSMAGQEKKLLASIALLVQNLHKPNVLNDYLMGLGARHVHYGVNVEHYPMITENLLAVMEELAGESWSIDVKQAWEATLNTVSTIMLKAYESTEKEKMIMSEQTSEEKFELARLRSAVNGAMTAIIMIDRDFVITYVNQATITMLRPHEAVLRQTFPRFDLDNLVGTNIDTFHKDPRHQRAMLANPNNLPYSTEISVGHLIFKLNVTAMIDDNGDYIGNSLEWFDMTQTKAYQLETARLKTAVSGAMTAIIMIDRDFVITYVNEATISMLKPHEGVLKQAFPHFSLENFVGTNIDMFHKNPVHQRTMLADPNNLPYTTEISVGPLFFKLNVTAMIDEAGNYIGNSLEWLDITESKWKTVDYEGQLAAITKSMGVISFDMDGNITELNDNFLDVVGYRREDVVGRHHRMFAEQEYANSSDYREFWAKLNRGEFIVGDFKRIGSGGKEIWLQASYNPILDMHGKPFKVVKYATEITDAKLASADSSGQIEAIGKAMGVISFDMDGTILDINENFLDVVGYRRDEVIGHHHRMFADQEYANSSDYREFWAKLNRGEYDAGEYLRIGKGGKEVWLQASYNPIIDTDGKPFKVVKYASDITKQKELQANVEKILASTSMVMNGMSSGDLTQQIDGELEGEFALLQQAVNDTVIKMAETVKGINEAARSISSGASEISVGNLDLSQRTEQQASSLEETASSMEELTSTVRQNSDNARQANQLAASSRELAEKGGSVIKNAIEAMSAISSSSRKVTDIIGVIDEIAFQTNLLALNAAVEAARAGEQGRGFAVVASEVRNLAQRSASAAKEIKELINDSGEKVKEGSMLVDESGRTLEEIVASSKKVGDIISEIAAAGSEQTQGIEQVNKAVTQMDEMTQQNAALVEQAAAASEALDQQGKSLEDLMAFFNVGESDYEQPRVTAKPSSAPHKASRVQRAAPKPAMPAAKSSDDEWDEF